MKWNDDIRKAAEHRTLITTAKTGKQHLEEIHGSTDNKY